MGAHASEQRRCANDAGRDGRLRHVIEQGGRRVRKLAITTAVVSLLGSVAATAKARQDHDWWSMVQNCESKGVRDMWYTNTGNGFFFGPQFTRSTWHDFGGGPVLEMGDKGGRPMHGYSIRYIIGVAERVLRGQGFSAWPNCYGYL